MRSVLLPAGLVFAGFECCPGNESFCRAQSVLGTSLHALDPSRARGAPPSLKEWPPGLVLLNQPGWRVPGSSSGAGRWDGAAGSTGVSCLHSAAPSRGLLLSCTQHFIKASRDHRAISSPIPAPGENLNPAALGCAGAGWELWAGAWVEEVHPEPSVHLLHLLPCRVPGP